MKQIYLDFAAATPIDPAVVKAMQPYLTEVFYNPSAIYSPAKKARDGLETARAGVAHWLGARPSEIIFTAGGTEANNLAIHGIMRNFPEATMLTSSIEHESVLVPAKRYRAQEIAVTSAGQLDMAALRQQLDDSTVLISVMYANNEIGTIQPIREISRLVAEIRRARRTSGNKLPLYFHTDGAQAGNYLDLHVARLGVDMLTLNGGKIYGPKQSGVLYVKAGIQLQPVIEGGGQERNLRSGTENVASAVGLATALDLVQTDRQAESRRLQELQRHFLALVEARLPQAIINGSRTHRLPNNIHLTLPGHDNERLLIQLDSKGILAAAGSACSASNEEASHVLRALGLSDTEAQASLRFTMGRSTTAEEVKRAVAGLSECLAV